MSGERPDPNDAMDDRVDSVLARTAQLVSELHTEVQELITLLKREEPMEARDV